MSIRITAAYDFPQEVGTLFSEYTQALVAGDPSFEKYLEIQNYGEELNHLETKYGLPGGRLYLAYWNEELAGCIGLRKIDDENCEMKRLYVRQKYRGLHIGNQLVEKIMEDGRSMGYKHLLLDTLPFLQSAIHMYKQYGFYEIGCYNDNPMDNSIYMKLDLS